MWEPPDLTALPTPQELMCAQEAINNIEEALRNVRPLIPETKLRMEKLEQELRHRRAWIAPVRRLPFDLLSMIFSICGEDDWKTPLSIAAVSHSWRDAVIATPRAWAFLDLDQCQEHAGIKLFFQRSGSVPLHIYLPVSLWALLLDPEIAERLHCLAIEALYLDAGDVILPNLRWLLIRGDSEDGTPIDCINHARLPALRHFATRSYLQDRDRDFPIMNPRSYSRLESLSLLMVGDLTWLDLLQACCGSLRCLKLDLVEGPEYPKQRVSLPRLKCLEIYYRTSIANSWPLDLETPSLETYIEAEVFRRGPDQQYSDRPFHSDVTTVKFMRTELLPASFSSFPMLRTLQINDYPHRVSSTSYEGRIIPSLSQLCSTDTICPDLILIELFADWSFARGQQVMKKVQNPRSIHLVTGREWTCDPPGRINYSWGAKIPCDWDQ